MYPNNIRIVMVETSHPGNIGACARAMKNMGLSELYLVSPHRFPDPEASARASGADDILASAMVVPTLAEALADCDMIFGASARQRSITWPEVDPRQCAEVVLAEEGPEQVAIVFGRESSGLDNTELDLCHYLLHIPCNPEFSSLNVAAAIQVVCYELMMQQRALAPERKVKTKAKRVQGEARATAQEMEAFFEHLEQTLYDIEFLDPANPRLLMRRMRRMFGRTRVERTEMNILRGVLTAAQIAKKGRVSKRDDER